MPVPSRRLALDLLAGQAVHRLCQRGPHAVIEAELGPCLVHVDPAAVDHAVGNLIDNAVKWSPPGAAVRVVVETAGSWSAIAGRASRTRISRTSSSASTGRPTRGECQARG